MRTRSLIRVLGEVTHLTRASLNSPCWTTLYRGYYRIGKLSTRYCISAAAKNAIGRATTALIKKIK